MTARRRILAAAVVAIGASWAAGGVAAAHQPVFVDETTPPAQSPLLEDGTVSFAVYGRIDEPGGAASFRVRHGEGQTFTVEVLVPDRAPENGLDDFGHLSVTVTDPAGEEATAVGDEVLATFDEPFTQTSYLRVITWEAPAVPGVSTVTVRSEVPTRFTVATGFVERFDGEVSDYEPRPISELGDWYETPPPEAPVTGTTPTEQADDDAAVLDAAPPAVASDDEADGPAVGVVLGVGAVVLVAVGAGVLVARSRRGPS